MPENWKTCKLDDIAEILNSKRMPLNSRQRAERKGDIPYYGASGIMDYVNDYLFDGEHVLISEDGENLRSRKTPIAFKANGRFWVNNHAHIVRGQQSFLNDWIVYYIANLNVNPYISGAVQPKLNKQNLLSIPIVMPELKEVEAIASILSALDDKIENNLAMNKTLEAMAMALYKHWFVDFGPFQDGHFIDSELGLIPEGWEVKRLGEVYNTTSGGTPSRKKIEYYQNGTIPWVKSKELYGNFVVETEENITELGLSKSSAKLVPEKTVMLAMYGATVGESSILSQPASCNQAICAIMQKNLTYVYIFQFLRHFKNDILNQAVGSAQQNISQAIIKNLQIVVPPSCLDIFSQIEMLYSKAERNLIENQTLTKLRDILLPKLISGEVRVKDIEEIVSEAL